MSYHEYTRQIEAMSERDRQIWNLYRKGTSALGFAIQNAHSQKSVQPVLMALREQMIAWHKENKR